MKKILCIWFIFVFAVSLVQADIPLRQGSGQEIIKASGVKGGLVVCVGAEKPEFVTGLHAGEQYLVHALDTDQKNVDSARKYIKSKGLYGKVSVDTWDGKNLPYADNLVNLIVVQSAIRNPQSEIERVLAPRGVALIKANTEHRTLNIEHRNGKIEKSETSALDVGRSMLDVHGEKWIKLKKPVPKEIDDWTHYLHGADGNAVADDSLAAEPRSVQWIGLPRWGRSHEELNSLSACVSAKGRVFYILDEAPLAEIGFSAQWKLIARDAFSGVVLWKRDIGQWIDHLRTFRTGPVHLPRRLVAVDDRVYATMSIDGPLTVLNAVTGETISTFQGTEFTEEIIVDNGTVYLVIGSSERKRFGEGLHRRGEPDPTDFRYIAAFDAESGKRKWKIDTPKGEYIMPLTLAVRKGKVFFQSSGGLICASADSGKQLWKTPKPTPARRYAWSAPTLVAHDKVVFLADRIPGKGKLKKGGEVDVPPAKDDIEWGVHSVYLEGPKDYKGPMMPRRSDTMLDAFSVEDGKKLWSMEVNEGYNVPVDLFIAQNLLWVRGSGLNMETGKRERGTSLSRGRVGMIHARCYRNKATEKHIFNAKSGIEVASLEKGWLSNNSWIRGTCQYGIMPCNGLVYAPPNACACYNKVKLQGFIAASPQRTGKDPKTILEKGPAYSKIPQSEIRNPKLEDWPMYRHDFQRSGSAATKIAEDLKIVWSSKIGGALTQPVSVAKKVLVASIDTHTLYALDVATGKQCWSYTVGSRIDSSPTLWKGLTLFGSADGWVYCLRTDDGELVWRFRAAPAERLVFVNGQLESTWPVHGSVLVQNDTVYFAAGRNSYIDGGLRFYGLNPQTGEKVFESPIYHLDPETGAQIGKEGGKEGLFMGFEMEGTLNDVLSGDGENVYLKHLGFDKAGKRVTETKPHLFTPTGFLGEEWFIRSYWTYAMQVGGGFFYWGAIKSGDKEIRLNNNDFSVDIKKFIGKESFPAGRIMSFNDSDIFGYGRIKQISGAAGHRANIYHLFGMPKDQLTRTWTQADSMIVRAMVLSGDKLLIAGVPDVGRKQSDQMIYENEDAALETFLGKKGAMLQFVSTADGSVKSEIKLPAMPGFDGMSAANGRLFISLKNGEVVCMAKEK
ncbi:PQQ-binding-like beta-propeller repeat protein [Verrucomicrobiota bacterium]